MKKSSRIVLSDALRNDLVQQTFSTLDGWVKKGEVEPVTIQLRRNASEIRWVIDYFSWLLFGPDPKPPLPFNRTPQSLIDAAKAVAVQFAKSKRELLPREVVERSTLTIRE